MSDQFDGIDEKLGVLAEPLEELFEEHADRGHRLRALLNPNGYGYAVVCETCDPGIVLPVMLALGDEVD